MASTKKIKAILVTVFTVAIAIWLSTGTISRAFEQGGAPERRSLSHSFDNLFEDLSVTTRDLPAENACATCHEQTVKDFSTTVHAKNPTVKGQDGSASCQSCHGDATEHMANGGDIAKIINPAKLKSNEASQTCMSCHSQMGEHKMWRGGKHETAGLSCLDCHSAHHSPAGLISERNLFANLRSETKLLKGRTESDTCYKCHSDVRKAETQRSTHLFRNEDREARISCSSCHDSHGAFNDKMLKTANLNETCYTCHTEKRGPFLWEHAPATENCASCHKSHGSNHAALLKARAPMLCQQCHIQGRHQSVPGKTNSVFTFNRSCLNCHGKVHGSNHPSGINLQR